MSRQPWDSISLPAQYIPDGKLCWFPPLFFLGVPLTTEEVCHLARRLNLSLRGDGDYNTYYLVARHLSEICGFAGPNSSYPLHHVTVEECDAKGRPWMLALVSNYQIPRGLDYSEPYTIMLEALEEAFGESKKIEWWLEHPLNHAPKDLMVRGRYHDLPWCKGVDEDVSSGLDSNRRGYTIGTRHMIMMIKRLHFSEVRGGKMELNPRGGTIRGKEKG
jgi:hypothetical protein